MGDKNVMRLLWFLLRNSRHSGTIALPGTTGISVHDSRVAGRGIQGHSNLDNEINRLWEIRYLRRSNWRSLSHPSLPKHQVIPALIDYTNLNSSVKIKQTFK
ncbi:hypothetical protein J6590_042936 [Homalodisca vitripennis]|nr:hypothetical protein J6590_042936 [Homalodisca vitripennis]